MSKQQKIFLIPKLQSKGCRTKILPSSRTYKEILQTIQDAYFDSNYSFEDNWTISSIEQVVNQESEKSYQEKRQELRSALNSSDVGERFAFAIVDSEEKANDACRNGVFSGHEMLTSVTLGKRTDGVHVWTYSDVPLRWATINIFKAYLIVYKVMRGRTKLIKPAVNNSIEPTPNFESHVSRVTPNATTPFRKLVNCTQIFVYEYDEESLPNKNPRHCYPYAVVTCSRPNDSLPWKKSKVRKPRLNTVISEAVKKTSKADGEPAIKPLMDLVLKPTMDEPSEFIVIDEYVCENSNPKFSDDDDDEQSKPATIIKFKQNKNDFKPKKILVKSKKGVAPSFKKVRFSNSKECHMKKRNMKKDVIGRKNVTDTRKSFDRKKAMVNRRRAFRRKRYIKRDRWRKYYGKMASSRTTNSERSFNFPNNNEKSQYDFSFADESSKSCNGRFYNETHDPDEESRLPIIRAERKYSEFGVNNDEYFPERLSVDDFNEANKFRAIVVGSINNAFDNGFNNYHSRMYPSNCKGTCNNNWDMRSVLDIIPECPAEHGNQTCKKHYNTYSPTDLIPECPAEQDEQTCNNRVDMYSSTDAFRECSLDHNNQIFNNHYNKYSPMNAISKCPTEQDKHFCNDYLDKYSPTDLIPGCTSEFSDQTCNNYWDMHFSTAGPANQDLINDNLEVIDMDVSSPEPTVPIFRLDTFINSKDEQNDFETSGWHECANINKIAEHNVFQDENGRLHVYPVSEERPPLSILRGEPYSVQSQQSQTVVAKKKRKHFHGKKLLTERCDPSENRDIPIETPEGCEQPDDPRKLTYCDKNKTDFSVLCWPKNKCSLSLKARELIKQDYRNYITKKINQSLPTDKPTIPSNEFKEPTVKTIGSDKVQPSHGEESPVCNGVLIETKKKKVPTATLR